MIEKYVNFKFQFMQHKILQKTSKSIQFPSFPLNLFLFIF